MTVGAGISVADGNLTVLGKKVLSHVHDNVLVTPASGGSLLNGAFIGVSSDQKGSRRVFPIGKLEEWVLMEKKSLLRHSFCLLKYTKRQFLLIEVHKGCDIDGGIMDGEEDHDGSTYAVLLPLLEGDFRAVLYEGKLRSKTQRNIKFSFSDPYE